MAWATLVVYVVAAFFFGLMLGPSDPFAHVVGSVPTNGPGPNSLLQDNPLVLVHPPMLYLGLVGFTLPSPSPSPRSSLAGWTRTGRVRPGGGRCSPGPS